MTTPENRVVHRNALEASQPTAILVLGMHRSGTSALARVLNLLGAEIGKGLIPASSSNVSGYWENEAIVALHDRILAEFDRRWDSLELMPHGWQDTEIARKASLNIAAELERQFSGEPLILIKDPRLSLLAPLWPRALEAAGRRPMFALPIRHPAEAAASLAKREGFTRTHALALWLRYLGDSEAYTVGHPRVFLDYSRLLGDWRSEVRRLASALGLRWREPAIDVAAAVDAFLDPGLQHHRVIGDNLPPARADLESGLESIYYAALGAAADETGAEQRLHQMLRASRAPGVLWRALADSERDSAYSSSGSGGGSLHTNVVVYFGSDVQAFDELHCAVTSLPIDDSWHAVSMRLHGGGRISKLRLDVADLPGVYRVRHVAIAADNRRLAFGTASALLNAATVMQGVTSECEEADTIQVVALSADPGLELELPEWLQESELLIGFEWRGAARLRVLFGHTAGGVAEQMEAAIDGARPLLAVDDKGQESASGQRHSTPARSGLQTKVYFAGEGQLYAEERLSAVRMPSTFDSTEWTFELAARSAVRSLRIVPGDRSGIYCVESITLSSPGGRIVVDGGQLRDLSAHSVSGFWLPDEDPGRAFLFSASKGPYFELALPEDWDESEVTVTLRWSAAASGDGGSTGADSPGRTPVAALQLLRHMVALVEDRQGQLDVLVRETHAALELHRHEIDLVEGRQGKLDVLVRETHAALELHRHELDLVEGRQRTAAKALRNMEARQTRLKAMVAQARAGERRVRNRLESEIRELRIAHLRQNALGDARVDELRRENACMDERMSLLLGRLDVLESRELSARLRGFPSAISDTIRRPIRSRWLQSRLDYLRHYRFVVERTHDLAPIDGDFWEVRGDDPQILTRNLLGSSPTAGWYAVKFDFRVQDDSRPDECGIYADYGGGMNESTFISLPTVGFAQQAVTLCRFAGDVRGIRFDPTAHGTIKFRFGGISMRKLTRWETAARLVSARIGAQMRSPGGLSVMLRETWRILRESGFRGVLDALTANGSSNSDESRYAHWVECHDTLDDAQRSALRAQLALLPDSPVISVVLPVYNTPERWLRRCIESVLAQIYPHWELCIADDASSSPETREILAGYAARDPRIKVTYRRENGHICAASNSALELATGDFVALLDHDDELSEHALAHVVLALSAQPQARLLYSDEDKIDTNGRRYAPYFKPAWNPELLLSQNYLCHLVVVERTLVSELGGFRVGFEGSQDHDLVLRCIQRIEPGAIVHIARILYHWRAIGGSTAKSADQKTYAQEAGVRAVQDHLDRTEAGARVGVSAGGHYRVRYPLPDAGPLVSLIIPTRDKVSYLARCIRSIVEKTTYRNYEIVVVDNQSSEQATLEYFEQIRADERVRIIRYDAPFNYSTINNHAAARARGSVIGLVNNDIEVISEDWLSEMVGHAIRPHVGVVGAMLYYPDDTIQHAGVIVGMGGVAGHAYLNRPRGFPGQMNRARLAQNLSAVTAACMVLRKSLYEEVGGFDEKIKVAFNDIDFCLRVRRRGYLNLWTPYAELYHHESVSRGYEDSPEKRQRFNEEIAFMQRRWGSELQCDPAYNPNLPLDGEPFSMPVRRSRSDVAQLG